jgi:hypothetical protein
MPSYRLKRIVQVVKLIRSRGIGLYFISQNPTDVPDEILAQLGNRVQHALRAYTPSEQKIVKAAADAFRTNSKFNTQQAISELGTGEALISFQDEKGAPSIVERATILPPQSYMGAINDMVRMKVINNSDLCGKYDEAVDNESAHEKISKHNEETAAAKAAEEQKKIEEKEAAAKAKEEAKIAKEEEKKAKEAERIRLAEEKQQAAIKKQQEALEAKQKAKMEKRIEKYADRFIGNVAGKAGSKVADKLFKNLFK